MNTATSILSVSSENYYTVTIISEMQIYVYICFPKLVSLSPKVEKLILLLSARKEKEKEKLTNIDYDS